MPVLIQAKDLIEKDVIELLGLGHIADSQKQELYNLFNKSLSDRVILRMSDLIDPSDQDEWLRVLDSDDDDKVKAFLADKKISVPDLVIEETLYLKNKFISIVRNSR